MTCVLTVYRESGTLAIPLAFDGRLAAHLDGGGSVEIENSPAVPADQGGGLPIYRNGALAFTGLSWLLLYLLAPATLWSTYANLGNPVLIAVMFLCEHLWRRRVLPPEERPRIADVVRAWRHHHAPPAA